MKSSLIVTVYNECDNITNLLGSIKNQTKVPDEVIIVDGGSRDNTVEAIERFTHDNLDLNIKLFRKPGFNISKGRNFAIQKSKGKIILVTDGGCILDKYWSAKLIESFMSTNTEVVGGIFESISSDYFRICMSKLLVPSMKEFNGSRFIPSSRSLAFRKSCWEKVGGYPEYLYTAEDTLFIMKIFKYGFTVSINKDAKVYWEQRTGLYKFVKQIFRYSVGDGLAKNFSSAYYRSITNTLLLILSLIIKPFFILYLFTFLYGLWRHRSRFSLNELLIIPGILLLRLIEEFVRPFGFLYGSFSGKLRLRLIASKKKTKPKQEN